MARFIKHHKVSEKPSELQIMYRTTDRKKYELIARLTVNYPSMQKAIDARLFPAGWEEGELEPLRKKQRKEGFKDSDFLHNKDRVAMDLKPLIGRKK